MRRSENVFSAAVFTMLLSGITPAMADDFDHGEALYENHCQFCHEDGVHRRQAAQVKSIDTLRGFVISWSIHTGLNWSTEDIESVVRYLNQRYYQFDKP